jgi:hypothetical protein
VEVMRRVIAMPQGGSIVRLEGEGNRREGPPVLQSRLLRRFFSVPQRRPQRRFPLQKTGGGGEGPPQSCDKLSLLLLLPLSPLLPLPRSRGRGYRFSWHRQTCMACINRQPSAPPRHPRQPARQPSARHPQGIHGSQPWHPHHHTSIAQHPHHHIAQHPHHHPPQNVPLAMTHIACLLSRMGRYRSLHVMLHVLAQACTAQAAARRAAQEHRGEPTGGRATQGGGRATHFVPSRCMTRPAA